MKKLLLLGLILFGLVIGCTTKANVRYDCTDSNICNVEYFMNKSNDEALSSVEKIEIYHFHGTHQCYSCITVGNYAEETVKTNFKEELESGKIIFDHINAELPENREIAIKYGVTGSSLWLGIYDNEGFHPEENANVWYKINNKEDYMSYLTGLIQKRLAGDFS